MSAFFVTPVSRRRAIAAGLATLFVAIAGVPALAHDADCPKCALKVVQDTPEQDNEVALRYGRKRIEYRCVYCALAEAQTDQYAKGDLTILAPSEKKGQPVPVTRAAGKWSAPEGVIFVGVKVNHKVCPITYRTFTNRAAFDAYVKKNQAQLKDAKPLTLDQMLVIAKS